MAKVIKAEEVKALSLLTRKTRLGPATSQANRNITMISALLPVLLCVLWGSIGANEAYWDKDIGDSLKSNIVGCKWHTYRANISIDKTNFTDEFSVRAMNPTRHETILFKIFPATLTQSNKEMTDLLAKNGFTQERWANQVDKDSKLPANHVARDRKACLNQTMYASAGSPVVVYEQHKSSQRGFYVMHARQALIHPSGSVALQCGYYVGNEGCENKETITKSWFDKCKTILKAQMWTWDDLFDENKSKSTKMQQFLDSCLKKSDLGIQDATMPQATVLDKVFTIPAIWDDNYHNFVTDSLPRLSRNFRYLKSHPDIKIHLRSYEQFDAKYAADSAYKAKAKAMREAFLSLLGISPDRVVTGAVLANEVFVPRFMQCSSFLSHYAELRLLNKQLTLGTTLYMSKHPTVRNDLFSKMINGAPDPRTSRMHFIPTGAIASLHDSSATPQGAPRNGSRYKNLVIYQDYTDGESTDLAWNNATLKSLTAAFTAAFPSHQVFTLSSKDIGTSQYCLPCEIALISHADVFVAAHGRSLTNMLFLRPGAVVVEVVGSVSARHMPLCGYYGPMAAGLGLHHYIYAYDHKVQPQFSVSDLAAEAFKFYGSAETHNHVNLVSKLELPKQLRKRKVKKGNK
ncbi:DUF563 domain-containing protein [archaeon]|nr:MAG: DUF563 domain-containing protein [archaeon]